MSAVHLLKWQHFAKATLLQPKYVKSALPVIYKLNISLQSYLCTDANNQGLSNELQGFIKAQETLSDLINKKDAKRDHQPEIQNENEVTGDENGQSLPVLKRATEEATEDVDRFKTFAQLYKDSPTVRLGDFTDQLVIGKIVMRVNDEIHIDYGGKFNCVCRVPKTASNMKESNNAEYREGKEVIIAVKDHEMTARFMGYDKDMTLLEADARLVSLFRTGKLK